MDRDVIGDTCSKDQTCHLRRFSANQCNIIFFQFQDGDFIDRNNFVPGNDKFSRIYDEYNNPAILDWTNEISCFSAFSVALVDIFFDCKLKIPH